MRLNSKTYIAVRSGAALCPSNRAELVRWFFEFSDHQFEKILVFRIRDDVQVWELIEKFCKSLPKLLKQISIGICRVLESSEMEIGSQTPVFFSDGVAKSRLLSRLVDLGGVCLTNNIPATHQKYETLTHRGEILFEFQMAATRTLSIEKSVHVLPLRFEDEMPALFEYLSKEKGRILYGEGGLGKSERAASLAEVWRVHFKSHVIWVDGRRHQGLTAVVSEVGRCLGVSLPSTIVPKLKFYDKVLIVVVHCQETINVVEWLESLDVPGVRYLVTTEELMDHRHCLQVGAIDDYRIRLAIQYYNLDLTQTDLNALVSRAHGNLRIAGWLGLQSKNLGLKAMFDLDVGESSIASENIHLDSVWATYSERVKDVLKLMDICVGGMPIEIAKQLFSKEEWSEIAGVKDDRFRGDFFLRLHSQSRVQLLPHASRFLNGIQNYLPKAYLDEYCQIFREWILDKYSAIDSSDDTPALIALRDEVLNFLPIVEHGTEEDILIVSRALEIVSRRLGPFVSQNMMVGRILERSQNEALRLLIVHKEIRARHLSIALELLDEGSFVEFEAEKERVKSLIFLRQNDFDQSLKHANKSVALATVECVDECRLRKAEVLMRFRKDDQARELLSNVFETARSENVIASVHLHLGQLLTEVGEAKKGRPYLLKSIAYYQKVGSVRDLVDPFLTLGRSAFHQGKTIEAQTWFEDAEVATVSSGIFPLIQKVQSEKAYHFALIGDIVRAREALLGFKNEKSLEGRTKERGLMIDFARVLIACADVNIERAQIIVEAWNLASVDQNSIHWVLARILKVYVRNLVNADAKPLISMDIERSFSARSQFLVNQLGAREENKLKAKIQLSPDASLVLFNGETILLGRRLALRRIVLELANRSRNATPISVDDTFTIGWLDEVATQSSRKRRVYSAINRLRNLGIPVTRVSEGYLLKGYQVVFTSVSKL